MMRMGTPGQKTSAVPGTVALREPGLYNQMRTEARPRYEAAGCPPPILHYTAHTTHYTSLP